jgi:hypothetical protein
MSNSADEDDVRFFFQHPDRRAHIRTPKMAPEIDEARAAHMVGEMEREFRTLGAHKRERRRIILWRVPSDNPFYDPMKPAILKIPFLLFGDETVEDRDSILLPILHELMEQARGGSA